MISLLKSELFRLVKRPMPWFMLLIVAAGQLLLYGALWAVIETQSGGSDTSDLRDSLRVAQVPEFGLGLAVTLATILAVIVASSTIGAEYGWGTIRSLLPRSTSRFALLAAKLITVAIYIVVLVAFGFLVSLGASALVTAAADLNDNLGDGYLTYAIASVGRAMYTIMPYAALSFMVALWSRSNAAGISVGLAVYLLEDLVLALIGLAGDVVDWLPDLLLSNNVSAILALNEGNDPTFGGGFNQDLPNPWQAALVLGLWTVLFLGVSQVIFQRRDVTSG